MDIMPKLELLSTNEYYNRALEMLEHLRILQASEGLTARNMERYKVIMTSSSKMLLLGKIDAVNLLTYFYGEGLTGTKEDYNYKLFLSIGSKLGKSSSTKKLLNLWNTQEAEKEATIWADVIRYGSIKYYSTKISIEDIANAYATLEEALTKNFIGLGALENCFNIAKYTNKLEELQKQIEQEAEMHIFLKQQVTHIENERLITRHHSQNNDELKEEQQKESDSLKALNAKSDTVFNYNQEKDVVTHNAKPLIKTIFRNKWWGSNSTDALKMSPTQPDVPRDIFSNISHKTIEIKELTNGNVIKLQEQVIKISLKFRVNTKLLEIKKYTAITIPDIIENVKTPHLEFIFNKLNGSKMNKKDTAYLKLDYNDDGKVIKLSLPNPPTYFQDKPFYPVLSIYKSKFYILPINSGQYQHLVEKIYENGGNLEINQVDSDYNIELLGEN